MKAKLSRGLLISLLFAAAGAHAGARSLAEVRIFNSQDGYRSASGAMTAARNSSDFTQSIGCSNFIFDSTSSGSMVCNATNSSGETLTCQTTNENMISMVRNLNAASLFSFVADWDGNCIRMSFENGSEFL